MSSLYLLRHGQASFGADDYDRLSPLGLRQALSSGSSLAARDLYFDQVYVGPRRRHFETAEALLAAIPGAGETCRVEVLDEFAEGGALLRSARRRLGEVNWPSGPDCAHAPVRRGNPSLGGGRRRHSRLHPGRAVPEDGKRLAG